MESIELQALIERHFRDWEVTLSPDRMRFRGWWISASVSVTLDGMRDDVMRALRAFVTAAVLDEDLHGATD